MPPARRRLAYGMITSTIGLAINVLLAVGKVIVGTLSGSVAITADGFNNIADMASALVAIIGFYYASKPADHDHPFGHARVEYVAATIVGLLTLMIAWEIAKNAVLRIVAPEPVTFSWIYATVLIISMGLKFIQFYVNRETGKKLNSSVMLATSIDSLSDIAVTATVLLSLFLARWTALPIDGILALLVAVLIVRAGYGILKDTVNSLIGSRPSGELEKQIVAQIKASPEILGVHDVVVHNYGPENTFITAHVEVDAKSELVEIHEVIDQIERRVAMEANISLLLHIDPVEQDNPAHDTLRLRVLYILNGIDPALTLHDFRVVNGKRYDNLFFDVVVPPDLNLADADIKAQLDTALAKLDKRFHAVVVFDRAYGALPHNEAKD